LYSSLCGVNSALKREIVEWLHAYAAAAVAVVVVLVWGDVATVAVAVVSGWQVETGSEAQGMRSELSGAYSKEASRQQFLHLCVAWHPARTQDRLLCQQEWQD
jgi:hypothetical protein